MIKTILVIASLLLLPITAGGADTFFVPDSRTVCGHALTSNVTCTASDVGAVAIGGNAGTATALAANGTNCSAGYAPLGVDASGNAEGCWQVNPAAIGLGSVTNNAQTNAAVMPNTAPAAGQIPVGNAGGTAYAPTSVSGDCTLASTGAITCTKTNTVAFGTAATVNTGTSANQIVKLDANAKLPAVDGSQLTNLPSGSSALAGQASFIAQAAALSFAEYSYVGSTYSDATTLTFYLPAGATTLNFRARVKVSNAGKTATYRLKIGTNYSNEVTTTSTSYVTSDLFILTTGLTAGAMNTITVQGKVTGNTWYISRDIAGDATTQAVAFGGYFN